MSCRRARRGSASAGRASRARLRVPVFTGMDEAAVVVDATGDRPGRGRSTVYARRSPWRVFLRGCAIVVGLLELAHLLGCLMFYMSGATFPAEDERIADGT